MACYHPLRVALDQDGQLDWSVWSPIPDIHEIVLVPCRTCSGCQAAAALSWSIRCLHESMTHVKQWRDPESGVTGSVPNSCMVTLTYDDANLPEGGVLDHRHVQLWLKRLRRSRDHLVRYFVAGEYGSLGRPHYHALLFGDDLDDRYQEFTSDGQTLNRSFELDRIWPYGKATIDDMNFGTACYVAGYVTKKQHVGGNFTGPLSQTTNPETGETRVEARHPEYRQMSRAPGLGRDWIEANLRNVYPADEIVINGQSFAPPRYYDLFLRNSDPALYVEVQRNRLDRRVDNERLWTPERCASAEEIRSQRLRQQRIS